MAVNKRWTDSDINILEKYYGVEDVEIVSKRLNRTINAIHWQASKMNLKFEKSEKSDFSRRLSRMERMINEIHDVVAKSEIIISERWSDHEIAILKERYGKISGQEMAELLNKKKGSIYNKAIVLGLTKKTTQKSRLSKEIKEYIIESYPTTTAKKLANDLGIPFKTLTHWMNIMRESYELPKKNK